MVYCAVAPLWNCDVEWNRSIVEQALAIMLELGLKVMDQIVFPGELFVELEVIEEQTRSDLQCAWRQDVFQFGGLNWSSTIVQSYYLWRNMRLAHQFFKVWFDTARTPFEMEGD